ncbi:MAG: hypothetical protein EB127_20250, partial [Alphaproteobacteria bacterium]|nr:hypothetical protein [Alphaproteobacteria bacterium]
MDQEDELHSVTHAALNEFVYEDELLPEIDIREMISIEQMMQYNPSFVALSFNDIVSQMSQLLSVNVKNNEHIHMKDRSHVLRKAHAYAKLHESIINPADVDFTNFVQFCVDAYKKTYGDDDGNSNGNGNSNGDDNDTNANSALQFITAYTRALKAPSYKLQQIELDKVFTPFYVDDNHVNADGITIDGNAMILLNNVDGDHIGTKLTNRDNLKLNVTGARWGTSTSTSSQYVFDRVHHMNSTRSKNANKCTPWLNTRDSHILEDWIQSRLRPKFEETIKKSLNTIGSTHDVDIVLSSMGMNLAELGIDDFNKLTAHLDTIHSSSSDADTSHESDALIHKHIKKFAISKKYT